MPPEEAAALDRVMYLGVRLRKTRVKLRGMGGAMDRFCEKLGLAGLTAAGDHGSA